MSWDRMQFATLAATTFLGLGMVCYTAYGTAFLNETYLYHSRRKDPRHNFSIYFYNTYLKYHLQDSISWYVCTCTSDHQQQQHHQDMYGSMLKITDITQNDCRLAFLTQLVSTGAIGFKYAQQLPLCMMLQTMAFVAFNKVKLCGTIYLHTIAPYCS